MLLGLMLSVFFFFFLEGFFIHLSECFDFVYRQLKFQVAVAQFS